MAPLIAFLIGTLLARIAGWLGVDRLDSWSGALAAGLAVMFVLTSWAHLDARRRQGLIAMVPPQLPRPDVLVSVTGILEVLGAIGLLIPASSRVAAGCLGVLLLVLFPANVSAARRQLRLGDRSVTPIGIRTAMQISWLAACVVVMVAG